MPRSECSLLNLREIIFTELADKPQLTLTLFIQLTDFASGQADRFLGEERLHKTNLSAASVIDPVNKRFKHGLKKISAPLVRSSTLSARDAQMSNNVSQERKGLLTFECLRSFRRESLNINGPRRVVL